MGVAEEVLAAQESSEEEEVVVRPSRPFNPFDMVRVPWNCNLDMVVNTFLLERACTNLL